MLNCRACVSGFLACKGGGNRQCLKRNPRPAIVVAIIDDRGGIRTVVTYKSHLKYHVRQGEIARYVPGLICHEPIAWNDIPHVIATAKAAMDKWLDSQPNLTEEEHHAVAIYRLRSLEQNQGSLNLEAIVYT